MHLMLRLVPAAPCRSRSPSATGIQGSRRSFPDSRSRTGVHSYILLLIAVITSGAWAQAPKKVPTFQIRARVVSVAGVKPSENEFTYQFVGSLTNVTSKVDEWSPWLKYGRPEVNYTLSTYPAVASKKFPVTVRLNVGGVVDPTMVEAELKLDETGELVKISAEMMGPGLGIVMWRDKNKTPHAASMADYNQRYWKFLDGVNVTEAQRPKLFPIIDDFYPGDDNLKTFREGLENLGRAGFGTIVLAPSKASRDLLLKYGYHWNIGAVYGPPGLSSDIMDGGDGNGVTVDKPDTSDAWAAALVQPYLDAGYKREDVVLFGLADETSWWFPQSTTEPILKYLVALERFRDYLKSQNLKPSDVGADDWKKVMPSDHRQEKGLAGRKLFYWTIRFFSWDSARHFAKYTAALEGAFYPGMPIYANWNCFNGRFYTAGPFQGCPDPKNVNAALAGPDWFEFGRMGAITMPWVEDWFADSQAYQWSFYSSKLRCVSVKNNGRFGGYIVPRSGGDRRDGMMQKILCLIGSGGKAIKYFVFGPEYMFPGNCYSENAKVLPSMAEAHQMIGAAEDLLWPGERMAPEVAILMPRSSQAWDLRDKPHPMDIMDCTNTRLNKLTVDYMAEVFDLYVALQHASIPVDFVDEDNLTPEGLKAYRVLYVTEPDVPEEGHRGLAQWVEDGGTLVTVTGAATNDRYGDPCNVLSKATGIEEKARKRLLVPKVSRLKSVGHGKGTLGEFTAVGARGHLTSTRGDVLATFDDRSQAIMNVSVGNGRVVHFSWFPGMSYMKSATKTKDGLPAGFSDSIRDWIVQPTQLAGVQPPVVLDHALVEAPVLISEKGAAITMLNWNGEPLKNVNVTVRLPFEAKSVKSVKHGDIHFQSSNEGLKFSLPLDSADIIMVRP